MIISLRLSLALVWLTDVVRRLLANNINTNVILELIPSRGSRRWEAGDICVVVTAGYDEHLLPQVGLKHRREVLVS